MDKDLISLSALASTLNTSKDTIRASAEKLGQKFLPFEIGENGEPSFNGLQATAIKYDIQNVPRFSTTITTKELAETLGVNKDTINTTVKKLGLDGVLRQVKITGKIWG